MVLVVGKGGKRMNKRSGSCRTAGGPRRVAMNAEEEREAWKGVCRVWG